MSHSSNNSRAATMRLSVYERFGFGGVTRVAEGIGQSRQYVSAVLNEQVENDSTLDKIEAWLEAERQTAKEAQAA